MNELYRPRFLPGLVIAAPDRNGDRACLCIDSDVETAAQLGDLRAGNRTDRDRRVH